MKFFFAANFHKSSLLYAFFRGIYPIEIFFFGDQAVILCIIEFIQESLNKIAKRTISSLSLGSHSVQ